MTAARLRLPNKRPAETSDIEHAGLKYKFTVGLVDGSPIEVFISNHKAGNASDVAARDAGILLSLCLQYGCPIEVIGRALSRNSDGTASGVVGAVVDKIMRNGK
jgi:hypothetical protein